MASGACAQQHGVRDVLDARPLDEVWLVSARHLVHQSAEIAADPHLRVHQFSTKRGLVQSSRERLLASHDPLAITVVYVHGARVDERNAFTRTRELHALAAPHAGEQKLRFICWSWPNPATVQPLRDFREAGNLSDAHSYYLAWFLSQLGERGRISLVGFSYGPRIITGALHELCGGSLGGYRLADEHAIPRVRVALWTAAVHNDWLQPGRRHGHAMHCVDRMLLVTNTADPVLRRYKLIEPPVQPTALGFTGLAQPETMGAALRRIAVLNGARELGHSHSSTKHLKSSLIAGTTIPYILWHRIPSP